MDYPNTDFWTRDKENGWRMTHRIVKRDNGYMPQRAVGGSGLWLELASEPCNEFAHAKRIVVADMDDKRRPLEQTLRRLRALLQSSDTDILRYQNRNELAAQYCEGHARGLAKAIDVLLDEIARCPTTCRESGDLQEIGALETPPPYDNPPPTSSGGAS
jgi:hypothetical protein